MKQTLKELRNVTHTYSAGQRKKVKISNSINGINVAGSGENSIKDQLVEFNTGEYLQTIEDNSFNGCKKLQKVVLQSNTSIIGKNAFKDCEQLTDINIETAAFERIGDNAFQNIGVSSLNMQLFKVSLGEFGKSIFKSCQKLKSVALTANYIPESLFEDCNNLTSIELTLSSDGNNICQIHEAALYGIPQLQKLAIRGNIDTLPSLSGMSNLSSVTLELDSNPTIPDYMFKDTPNLKSIDFSNCVTNLKQFQQNALNGSNLTSIQLKTVTKQQLNDSMKSENTAATVHWSTIKYKIVKKEDTGNKYQYGKIYDDVDGVLDFAVKNKVPVLIINLWFYNDYIRNQEAGRVVNFPGYLQIFCRDLFFKWLACQKCLIVFSTNNIQITDIHNYFQGDEWESTMWSPYFAGTSAFSNYGGNVFSCGYAGNNIIRMQYDGTTQVQVYGRGVVPNEFFVEHFDHIDMPTKVYKFYNTNVALKAKMLTYDIFSKTTGIMDAHLNRRKLSRLYVTSQYAGERYDVQNNVEWPYYCYPCACLFVPYSSVDPTNYNYDKKADCTYTESTYVNAFQGISGNNLDKPAKYVQKGNNWNKIPSCRTRFKDVRVVKVENSQFFWFFLNGSSGKDGTYDPYYIPTANGVVLNESKIDSYSDDIKAAYNEYLKTDYADRGIGSDSGIKNYLRALELQINTWLRSYQLVDSLKPSGYVPNNIDYSYITTKPIPANCWNIGHDCTIIASGNTSVKWTQKTKSFK